MRYVTCPFEASARGGPGAGVCHGCQADIGSSAAALSADETRGNAARRDIWDGPTAWLGVAEWATGANPPLPAWESCPCWSARPGGLRCTPGAGAAGPRVAAW